MLTSKIDGGWIQRPDMQILLKFQVNRMGIDNFRNLARVDPLAYVDLKIIGGWLEWADLQMLLKFQVNQIKFDDYRNLKKLTFGQWWPFDLKNK